MLWPCVEVNILLDGQALGVSSPAAAILGPKCKLHAHADAEIDVWIDCVDCHGLGQGRSNVQVPIWCQISVATAQRQKAQECIPGIGTS